MSKEAKWDFTMDKKLHNKLVKVKKSGQKLRRREKSLGESIFTLMNAVPLMNEKDFWNNIELIRIDVKSFEEKYNIRYKRLLKNQIWQILHDDNWSADSYVEATSFVKTYHNKVDALYDPLFKVITGFGDDGYGDILDSFPLFGRKRYEDALQKKITGDSKNQYQGENYIRMKLRESLAEYGGSIYFGDTDD